MCRRLKMFTPYGPSALWPWHRPGNKWPDVDALQAKKLVLTVLPTRDETALHQCSGPGSQRSFTLLLGASRCSSSRCCTSAGRLVAPVQTKEREERNLQSTLPGAGVARARVWENMFVVLPSGSPICLFHSLAPPLLVCGGSLSAVCTPAVMFIRSLCAFVLFLLLDSGFWLLEQTHTAQQ